MRPNTTFSQNNGVIQLTGIASRYVGYYIAGILVILGIFPIIGGVLQAMPKPVLGGATLVMFATIAAAGVKILSQVELSRRNMLIMAVAFGLGLGVTMVPDALNSLPELAKNVLSNAVTMGGLAAIILNLAFSDKPLEQAPSYGVVEADENA
jgi:xanthine permease XanP